jgi:hypothetical protein
MNLINNAAELKANFGSLSLNFTWPNISSFAGDVERDIIGAAIGTDALSWFTDGLLTLDGISKQALTYLQRAVSYLTITKWSQTALFQFEDKALFLAKTTTGAIPSDKKLYDLRRYCEEEGFKFLDKALDLMENNLASFTQYRDSDTRQALNQGFIKTAIDFSAQRNINNSRLTFLSMFYFMIDIQEDKLPELMTPEYYALFKERYMAGTLADGELKLLPLLKKGVAMHTVAAACKQLPVQFTSGGLFLNKYDSRADYGTQDPADASRLQYLADDHSEKGDRFFSKIQVYMAANAGDLPGYVLPVVTDVNVNCEHNGIYSFPS